MRYAGYGSPRITVPPSGSSGTDAKHLIVVNASTDAAVSREACHELFYRGCIGYRNASGRRVDLFTTPRKDALLMIPGGSYRRLSLETNP